MARIATDPNYSSPTFPRATAGTDLFLKEDVQALAAAVSTHDHSAGKGLKVSTAGLQAPITLTMGSSGSGANQGTLNLVDTTGSANLVLVANTGVSKAIRCTNVDGGTLDVVNAANSAVIFSLNDAGQASFGAASATLTVTNWIQSSVLTASSSVNSPAYYCSGGVYYFGAANDNYIQRVSAGLLQTSGAWTVNGALSVIGVATLGSSLSVGTTIVATGTVQGSSVIATAGSHYSRAGGSNYLAGPTDQSVFGMWNPGEWRISSSPGNLYVLGVMTAEGGPVTGKGAYVNSASSITVKQNVVELDPLVCIGQVLDVRMRPVTFEYIDPMAVQVIPQDTPDAPTPTVVWTAERLGFIAEEVALVVPEAAGLIEGTTVAHGLTIEALVPVLWGAVRALDARVKVLEAV